MAEVATIAQVKEPEHLQETTNQEGEQEQEQGKTQGSFFDPDVLLFALPFAIIIDILDVVLAIGVIVNLIIGAPLLFWMVWKTGQVQAASEQVERVGRGPQERAGFQARQQQQLAARRKATSRAWRRGILYFLGGLVPILSIFVLWTWAIISTVRGK